MSAMDTKPVAARFYEEVINGRKLEVFDEIVDVGLKAQTAGMQQDRREWRSMLAGVLDAFRDYHQVVHDWVADGDKVVARWTIEGTQTGVYAGVPATGRKIKASGIEVFRIKNGKIVEQWCDLDFFGVLRQLGAVPALEELGKRSFR